MMQNVHLDPETDEDDLYSGYNDYSPIYDIEELENDAAFQQAVRTSHGRRPPITAKIPSTAVTRPIATGNGSKTSLASFIGRPVTGAIQDGVTRPMTAVRAAGFTKAALRGSAFDPLGQSGALLLLWKSRKRIGILKVNMGNIYLKQINYSKAIKFYRMALDQVPSVNKQMRLFYAFPYRCVEVVKASQYVELADDLEMKKAVTYLKQRDYNQGVKIFKMLEKKDSRVKSTAATNLSALYYMGKDFAHASSYADIAVNSDRYNPAALTNKGNTVFANGDYEKAAEFYKEALRNDSSCTEALYNIGLTYEKLNRLDEALDCFLKLHAILRNSAEVLYQIANIQVPTDPQVLAKLGELYDREGDKSQAFQYYCESYRYFPCNIEVVEWLGAYYIDTQFWEQAIQYFERASLIQPTQVKWQLIVASCFRRSGNYQKALDAYKDTHRKFPESVECLRFLVRLCTNLGLKDAQEYARKLKRLEKMKEIREQHIKSGRDGSGGSRGKRERSASSDSGQNCSASSKGERLSAKLRTLPGTNEPYESSSNNEIDASYVDPLGPQIERPKTAAKKRIDEDDFADEELGDDLLPE
nr:intraflagellar transport protein 88 homolog [Aotus nancymaae]